jgi:hypothetical protein
VVRVGAAKLLHIAIKAIARGEMGQKASSQRISETPKHLF